MTSVNGDRMPDAMWWYEWEGRQAGPVEHAALLDLVRSGQLGAAARIWRSGMRAWEALGTVPEVALALPRPTAAGATPPPSPAARAGGEPAPPSGADAGSRPTAGSPVPEALPEGMEPVSTAAVLGLGALTLGVYPVVKFYQAGAAYQTLAGRTSRLTTWFWLAIALGLLGGPLHLLGGLPGITAHVAAIAFTVLTLFEFLALRGEVVKRYAVAPALTSDGTHKALFITGLLTWWFLVGLVLLAVQAVKLFDDHRALGDALRARRAAPPPPAAPIVPGLAANPGARACPSCGNALAAPARFCDRCGRAVG